MDPTKNPIYLLYVEFLSFIGFYVVQKRPINIFQKSILPKIQIQQIQQNTTHLS